MIPLTYRFLAPSLCVLLASGPLATQAQESKTSAKEPLTWIFLNTGAAPEKIKEIPQQSLAKMQADHVGNFGTQFNKGTLIAAGPLGDNGFTRGTVILAVHGANQVAECFKTDPFVQNDILAVEAHPWIVDVMKLGAPKVPFELARHTLCVVKKGRNWKETKADQGPDSLVHLLPGLKAQARSGDLAISGPFMDGNDKLGILLFYSTNQDQIKDQLEKESVVAQGRVELELHPQFMGKGTLPMPGEDSSPPKSTNRRPLFDGRTFNGWEGETNSTWHIEGRGLVGGSLKQTVAHNDFLCTSGDFKNFDLRLKVKLQGTGFVNGGVQFRSQRLKDPPFEMTGYQADMGEGYWGSLYDESRRNKVLAHTHAAVIKRLVKTNDWND